MKIAIIYTSLPALKDERNNNLLAELAEKLIQEGLAACINSWPSSSYYRWEEKFTEEQEIVVLIKTTQEKKQELLMRLRELHPYQVPCIIELASPEYVLPEYAEWVKAQIS